MSRAEEVCGIVVCDVVLRLWLVVLPPLCFLEILVLFSILGNFSFQIELVIFSHDPLFRRHFFQWKTFFLCFTISFNDIESPLVVLSFELLYFAPVFGVLFPLVLGLPHIILRLVIWEPNSLSE